MGGGKYDQDTLYMHRIAKAQKKSKIVKLS